MRQHFESGTAFFVVAALSFISGLLQIMVGGRLAGVAFLGAGVLWFAIGLSKRRKSNHAGKDP